MINRRLLLLPALVALGSLAACSTRVPLSDPVYKRIDALQLQVNRMESVLGSHALYRLSAANAKNARAIVRMRGRLEVLAHRIARLRSVTATQDVALARSLARLRRDVAALASGAPPAAASPAPSSEAPASSSAASPAPQAAPSSVALPAAGASYARALRLLEHAHYHEAVRAFHAFLVSFPKDRLVPNADYWEGAAKLQLQDLAGALRDTMVVVNRYPTAPKAPDAMLQAGYIEAALGHFKQARALFTGVVKRYPDTTAARLAAAKLKTLPPP
jgi:tol-pal system protein YbgF